MNFVGYQYRYEKASMDLITMPEDHDELVGVDGDVD